MTLTDLTREDVVRRLRNIDANADRAGTMAALLWTALERHGEPTREQVAAFHSLAGAIGSVRNVALTTTRRLERENKAS